MIGSERDALIDQVPGVHPVNRLGGPLTMLAIVLVLWVSGRVALWESPILVPGFIAEATEFLAEASSTAEESSGPSLEGEGPDFREALAANRLVASFALDNEAADAALSDDRSFGSSIGGAATRLARGHQMLWQAALTSDFRASSWRSNRAEFEDRGERQAGVPVFPGTPPFKSDAEADADLAKLGRWSLDAWVFWRQGPAVVPTSQGRLPTYGANQAGANLQYRLAPASGHDPRLYVRAYRALIDEPESELSVGASARPFGKVPVRMAAEVRATENAFGNDIRPAAFAITEIPPIALPVGLSAEVYAGAGYVGGDADTPFIDGLASVTREFASFDLKRKDDVRFSLGAGVWGGAQRDAERIDIGPTMRLDLSLGPIPARVSVDYRERVGGDAAPDSGLAATLSTQF
ncbi:MAG: hypothetical protein AAFR64_03840 [Pseudomonadota bacterium]